jgi:hypothetical protein
LGLSPLPTLGFISYERQLNVAMSMARDTWLSVTSGSNRTSSQLSTRLLSIAHTIQQDTQYYKPTAAAPGSRLLR